jgi:TIR domain
MKHIFVSHAGADVAVAERLVQALRNAGHDTKVDTKELGLGGDSITFMNESIADAHTVVVLYSRHTPNAEWQKIEIKAAVWNEVAQAGGNCIVVRLDDTPIPPLLGSKIYATLDTASAASYQTLVEGICKTILPDKTASSVVSEAFHDDSSNPFRRVRAEYFEDRPDLLAQTFAPPDSLKMGALEEMKPCFLEGSRGTGKSMLLLSLRARNFLSGHKERAQPCKVFGFYLKLTRGAICNAGIISDPNSDPKGLPASEIVQIADIAAQELVVCILESLLSEVAFSIRQNHLSCDRLHEETLVKSVGAAAFPSTIGHATSIEDLLEKLADTHRDIANFIRRKFIYRESLSVPVAIFDLNLLQRTIRLIRNTLPSLSEAMFVVLLDEYENLFPYQQRIVNGFVKLGPPDFSTKIAKKLGSADVSGTTIGQELQETHDYTRLTLVYDVEDSVQLAAYHKLLKHIVANILRTQGLKEVDLKDLLPEYDGPEVDHGALSIEVAKLCKMTIEDFQSQPEAKQREKATYYREAAIYRILYGPKGKRGEKRFSGLSDLAFISSGVIRYFQEMLGVAYHLTYGSTPLASKEISLPPEKQSQAIYLVSEHNLTTLSRNVETHGEALKYLLLDIGDCLRHKLQRHGSEPEAARLTIEDPELLDQAGMAPLRRLLDVGVREGVFQTKAGRPAFKPKHGSDPQPSEFNICRIFAPVLQISPRLRWRTPVSCKALLGLATPTTRSQALQQLKTLLVPTKTNRKQETEHPLLFDKV